MHLSPAAALTLAASMSRTAQLRAWQEARLAQRVSELSEAEQAAAAERLERQMKLREWRQAKAAKVPITWIERRHNAAVLLGLSSAC